MTFCLVFGRVALKPLAFRQRDNQSKHYKTFIMEGQHIFFHSVCKSKLSTAVLLKTTHWYLSRLTKLTVKILCYVKASNLLATRRQGKDSVNPKKLLLFKKTRPKKKKKQALN